MTAVFEVYELERGTFSFRLKARDGQIVASGEEYDTRAAAEQGCESVKRAAEEAEPGISSGKVDQSWPPPGLDVVVEGTTANAGRFGFFGAISEGPDLSERVDEVLRGDLRETG